MKLNTQQLKASKNEGNTYVIGNPGTGKTTLILGRISYLLNKGVKPENILCMTFTVKATEELNSRITKEFGKKQNSLPMKKHQPMKLKM